MTTYKIVRHYLRHRRVTLRKGLTLEEAQEHCSDDETSSTTCTSYTGRKRSECMGPWFDGYEEE